MLGLPVAEWLAGKDHLPEHVKAEHCCARAGLPVAAVRSVIMSPAVSRVVAANLTAAIKHDGFIYIIERGGVLTVMTPRMYLRTMGSRHGSPRTDPSKKRRKEKRRLAEVV